MFWDLYDENGTRNGDNNTEPYINGVTLTLYDANGTQIDQQVTANSQGGSNATYNGVFPALRTYKADAGQYIVVTNPTVTDGSTVKLTKKSANGPIQSAVDSDFDRETNTLTLGTLSVNGLNNISAGFVKLPKVTASDVNLRVGQTVSTSAIIDEFVTNTGYNANNILINGGYKIRFTGVDESVATFTNDGTLVRNGNNNQIKSDSSLTGVAPGSYEVTVTVQNSLGDEVSTTFTVTVNDYFYVYHSSDNTVERISLDDPRIVDGVFDLTDEVAEGYLYGGYYRNYSGKSADFDALEAAYTESDGKFFYTDDGGTAYAGRPGVWKPGDAWGTETVNGEGGKGTQMRPKGGAVYFLKEVPNQYVRPFLCVVYDRMQQNLVICDYLMTALDDTNYSDMGLIERSATGASKYKQTVKFTVATTASAGTNTVSYTAALLTGNSEAKGYVVVWKYDGANVFAQSSDVVYTPAYVTYDGVVVEGHNTRTLSTGNGTYTYSFTSGAGYTFADAENANVEKPGYVSTRRTNGTIA